MCLVTRYCNVIELHRVVQRDTGCTHSSLPSFLRKWVWLAILGQTWIPASRLLHLEFTIIVYCTRVTCFRFFQLQCAYLCNTPMFASIVLIQPI